MDSSISSTPLRLVSSSELWPLLESLLRSRDIELGPICLDLSAAACRSAAAAPPQTLLPAWWPWLPAEAAAAATAAARKCGCKRLDVVAEDVWGQPTQLDRNLLRLVTNSHCVQFLPLFFFPDKFATVALSCKLENKSASQYKITFECFYHIY